MTSRKRDCVLVINADGIMKRASVSLMNLAGELEVVVSNARSIPELISDVTRINPDVVLINDSMPMAVDESVTHLLASQPKLKIIVASMDSNLLRVFNKDEMLLTRFDEFLGIIKAE